MGRRNCQVKSKSSFSSAHKLNTIFHYVFSREPTFPGSVRKKIISVGGRFSDEEMVIVEAQNEVRQNAYWLPMTSDLMI